MKRIFIETDYFQDGLNAESDKWLENRIKTDLLKNPAKGDLIVGSGGFRKLRISKLGRGKSGKEWEKR